MPRQIKFNTEARDLLKKGVDALANAVKVTLGPKGRNVIIHNMHQSSTITKDGVTVARHIELPDFIENMGAQMVKDVAAKTAELAGDGTTTATVLAQAIVGAGLKNIAAGANPMDLKRGIDKAVTAVTASLKTLSTPIGEDNTKIKQVATISANNDTEIGALIAAAMAKVKREGVITIVDSKDTETTMQVVEGIQFDRGYLSPHFVTGTAKMEVVYDNANILLCNNKISNIKEIIPVLEKAFAMPNPFIIICDELDGEALATLIVNKVQGSLKVAAVKSPEFGDLRDNMMEDIATLTGGTYITDQKGHKLSNANEALFGKCNRIIITKNSTTIIGGAGPKEAIDARIEDIRAQIAACEHPGEKKFLQERLAKLTCGIAILYVGAPTEVEMKEKKDRVDDALHATRAAVEEGIVPGGGIAYLRCLTSLETVQGANPDENTGIAIIKQILLEPLRQIVLNAGGNDAMVIQNVQKVNDPAYGYNAGTGTYENLTKSGVIDPTKVSRVALENAASIAGMLLTTECVLAHIDPATLK